MSRPEGWNQGGGYQDEVNGEFLWNFMCDAYEAGADAYEEALKAKGWRVTGESVIPAFTDVDGKAYPEIHLPAMGMKGWLVFIPEEEQP